MTDKTPRTPRTRRKYLSDEMIDRELSRARKHFGGVRGYELTPDGGIIILTGEVTAAPIDELQAARDRRNAVQNSGVR